MAVHTTTLVALFSLAQVVYSFNCSIPPIYVDIHKRAVHGSDVKQYGLFVGLGTPAQNFSMWPSLVHNETAFASTAFCTPSSPSTCANTSHGLFETELSPSWKPLPQYQASDSGDNTNVSIQYGEDTMNLYTHYFETDPATATICHLFPHTILSNSTSPATSFFGPSGVFGLGQLSTNLVQLAANKVITSKSFGLYLGAGYDRAGGVVNGSITYGGYDSGRFVNPVHNYTLAPAVASSAQSPLQVRVSQITLDFPDLGGGSLNLINDTGFTADITTSQYSLALPQSVTQAFASALHAVPANNADNSLRLTRPFHGNMTITLSDGFQVSFPPEWVANISAITPIAATASDTYSLGAAFLQYVYLAVNYDSTPAAFHLARAVPKNAYVMPKSLCPNVAPMPYETPQINAFAKGGLVGAAIGGIVGGSALTMLVWALVQRCLQRRAMKKRTVRFTVGKEVEMEDMEEVEHVAYSPVKTNKSGRRFVFRPPLTPGQSITPGAGAMSDFPFPSSSSEQRAPGPPSTFKGPVEQKAVAMTFDPPPRVPFEEARGQKGKARRL